MFAAKDTLLTRPSAVAAYQISRSLRFNIADTASLRRTYATSGTNNKIRTISAWVKRSTLGAVQVIMGGDDGGANQSRLLFQADDTLNLRLGGGASNDNVTTAVFRDPSAFYHVVALIDTTQATAANRAQIYVNGVQQTIPSPTSTQNQTTTFANPSALNTIGEVGGFGASYLGGYLTEFYFIDGQALTPSAFGSTNADTGVWQPKAFAGTYGTNGFKLNFSDNSNTTAATLGADSSGNGNNWTPNNFSVSAGAGNDSLVDSPTSYGTDTGVGGDVRGNYSTLNPLNNPQSATLANGNLDCATPATLFAARTVGTIGVSSGKWYWEFTKTSGPGPLIGIALSSEFTQAAPGVTSTSYGYYAGNGQKYNNNVGTSYGAGYSNGDVMGVALDMDAGTLTFYKNNTSQGTAFTGLTGAFVPAFSGDASGTSLVFVVNFGQRPFAYTAPSGFKALCTQNLPTPTIGATTATQAGKYFNTVLYTGTGSSLGVTGVGFQPDWVWVKGRSGATSNGLYDAVRGVQKQLISNSTAAETTETTGLTALGSDGFTVGALAQLNTSAATYVAWNWKANGSGSSNTAGSITSTVSASTTSGFSIVTYTAVGGVSTVGHGLGVVPSMMIFKDRDGTANWPVYHISLGNTSACLLDTTAASSATANWWNNTSPTSSVVTIGSNENTSTHKYVAYCFAPISGYSAFGSYTGNGSTDGPFVFTGFRPAFVMIKRTDSTSDWYIWDTKRDTYNVVTNTLLADTSGAETSATSIDDLSNGFKCRSATVVNASGGTYIYMAFAEAPQKFSLAR